MMIVYCVVVILFYTELRSQPIFVLLLTKVQRIIHSGILAM